VVDLETADDATTQRNGGGTTTQHSRSASSLQATTSIENKTALSPPLLPTVVNALYSLCPLQLLSLDYDIRKRNPAASLLEQKQLEHDDSEPLPTIVSTRSSRSTSPADPTQMPAKMPQRSANTHNTASSQSGHGWTHTPSTLTLAWLAISLPLVLWDSGYVLMRPATMPGGPLHAPIWSPYELYGRVDHMYGFKQWERGNGFTAAQGWLNVVETAMYLGYVWLWRTHGRSQSPDARKVLVGRAAASAALLVFSAAVMTLSKTVLYCEYLVLGRCVPLVGLSRS
jgi:hypothetical protein